MARWHVIVLVAAVCMVVLPTAVRAAEGDGWTQLFNGKDITGWRGKKEGGWLVEDGVLTWQKKCGYIWTEKRYGDFTLDLDFKVAPACNSGVFFRTANLRSVVYTGIEMQVADSFGKRPTKGSCGAVYDCLAPTKTTVKKAGEWNHLTITCKDNKIAIVMNGEQIIDMDLDQWTEAHKNPDGSKNKFPTAYKDMARDGHIGFQDHGRAVWYRNVRIKELK